MIEYEVGEIPSNGLGVQLRDLADNPINTVGYSSVTLELLDTGNRSLDVSDVTIVEVPTAVGTYIVQWPKGRSMFLTSGTYLMRFALRKADGSLDYTREQEITVRDFGRSSRRRGAYSSRWEVE